MEIAMISCDKLGSHFMNQNDCMLTYFRVLVLWH